MVVACGSTVLPRLKRVAHPSLPLHAIAADRRDQVVRKVAAIVDVAVGAGGVLVVMLSPPSAKLTCSLVRYSTSASSWKRGT